MWLGLAGVIAVGVAERASFASLFDLTVPYRITATFSTMHTGGSEIETYLVTAIPFVWLAFAGVARRGQTCGPDSTGVGLVRDDADHRARGRSRARRSLGRAAAERLAHRASRGKQQVADDDRRHCLLGLSVGAGGGLGGGYLQKRLANAGEDWTTRVSHWRLALAMRDRDVGAAMFGMGLGRFPEAYLLRSGVASLPGTYGFIDEGGNRFLRLGGGETLYMAQRVLSPTAGTIPCPCACEVATQRSTRRSFMRKTFARFVPLPVACLPGAWRWDLAPAVDRHRHGARGWRQLDYPEAGRAVTVQRHRGCPDRRRWRPTAGRCRETS